MREAARGKRRVVVGLIIGAAGIVVGLSLAARSLMADDRSRIESLIKTTCAGCHRLEGEPASRLERKPPISSGSEASSRMSGWSDGWPEKSSRFIRPATGGINRKLSSHT
jgi:mono/diheme cytochrome c family protein